MARILGRQQPDALSRPARCSCLGLLAGLCLFGAFLAAGEARAQCAAADVLRNYQELKKPASTISRPADVTSAAALPVWKTIVLGTVANSFALHNALDAARCNIGESAEEILARPAFTTSRTRMDVDLVVVSAADLGFRGGSARLTDIYARAQKLGFELASAEIGPQLRLQYFDQPIGEFLTIGMEPIKTWGGDRVLFEVINGGAGLVLLGGTVRADDQISVWHSFVFVRHREIAMAKKN